MLKRTDVSRYFSVPHFIRTARSWVRLTMDMRFLTFRVCRTAYLQLPASETNVTFIYQQTEHRHCPPIFIRTRAAVRTVSCSWFTLKTHMHYISFYGPFHHLRTSSNALLFCGTFWDCACRIMNGWISVYLSWEPRQTTCGLASKPDQQLHLYSKRPSLVSSDPVAV